MENLTTLQAETLVTYGGQAYGVGMQFRVKPEDAAALIKSGQAKEAPPKRVKAGQESVARNSPVLTPELPVIPKT